MRISDLNHFTEHHRFCVQRDSSPGSIQMKMLTHMYQPMIGSLAINLYQLLHAQFRPDQAGYSGFEQQRKLFMLLGIELNEQGRSLLLAQTSKLEAVGLLLSYRKYLPQADEYVFEYQLQAPLHPAEFFQNPHLTLLLRDKVGKYMVLLLRDELLSEQPPELHDLAIHGEALSIPFYELFQLNTQVIDLELEQAGITARGPAVAPSGERLGGNDPSEELQYSQLIARFPRHSANRIYVEQIRNRPQLLATIRFVAKKYRLSVLETCRLLDEDGVFDEQGDIQLEKMQHVALSMFRQNQHRDEQRKRAYHQLEKEQQAAESSSGDGGGASEVMPEKPVELAFLLDVPVFFQAQANQLQYNMILKNDSYTDLLQRLFVNRPIPDSLLHIFSKLNLHYGLPDEVMNVLIHYLHVLNRSWSKSYIEAIATEFVARNIHTFEEAVSYVREQLAARQQPRPNQRTTARQVSGTSSAEQKQQKPKLVVQAEAPLGQAQLSADELAEWQRLAARLDNKNSKD